MTSQLWIGLAMALLAGAMAGNCMLPMKYVRRWRWENTWFVFSLVSLILIPWALAWLTIGNPGDVYAGLRARDFAAPVLFGAGWGVAQVLFGLSIARLGLALGYAVIIGLGAVLGSLVPLFFQRREVLATPQGFLILSGVAVMAAGIAVSSVAGRRREKAEQKSANAPARSGYAGALLMAILCGLLAPMINFSLAFGQEIAQQAVRRGASAANAAYAVWPVGLAGGFVPNIVYSVYLLSKNGSWGNFRYRSPETVLAILMGVLWMGAVAIYGMATAFLGALGTSVGWALFQIFMIMAANLSGVVTGEWRSAGRGTLNLLWTGLFLLVAATVLISMGNR
jgi:L-rhamnose-H+ transport protein